MGSIQAHRIAFNSRCEEGTKENQQARDLARAPRIKKEVERLKGQKEKEEAAKIVVKQEFGEIDGGKLREYAFKVLEKLRDNPSSQAKVRFNAIKILKKLHDPGKDVNLIWKWVDIAWRYQTAHCPSCHKSFSMTKIKNPALDTWRKRNDQPKAETHLPDRFSRQLELIKRADKRRLPHKSQVIILAAPERHVVGLGAARGGKSYLLALFAALGICLPGVEIWILAATYDRASKEVEYLKRFLSAIFYPHFNQMFNVTHDKKTGEMIMTTKWGSEIRVKSASAKGSITGHALEFALCAEPGWLPPDIYEELRARMSERLGRIVALGTPKGLGGFVGRLTNMSGRDPNTGKILRWKPSERLIANGCPWGASMLVHNMKREDNPEYVKSEAAVARMELTDVEFASEFEGIGMEAEGAKFPHVRDHHLGTVDPFVFEGAVFVLGIDQGPKNFGACLTAFDGDKIVPCWEYFNSDEFTTMKKNLLRLRARVPQWIQQLGGNSANWRLTIVDRAPQLDQIFAELEDEGVRWQTEITFRHHNSSQLSENWRRETQEFVNNMARVNRLLFHDLDQGAPENEIPGACQLHDQVMQTIDVAEDRERETKSDNTKGWMVSDPWRGDHVLDAWYFCLWTILSQELSVPDGRPIGSTSRDPWGSQKQAFETALKRREQKELDGLYGPTVLDEPQNPVEAYRRLLRSSTQDEEEWPYDDA